MISLLHPIVARDLVQSFDEMGVQSVNDFNWLSQLRYYFNGETITVQMITTELPYGYEYLGNSGRLVITPLTDRCYRLVQAVRTRFVDHLYSRVYAFKSVTQKNVWELKFD